MVPNKTFKLMGGIMAAGLKSVVIKIEGTLVFSDNIDDWPREENGDVLMCMRFHDFENVTFTSSGIGIC